MLVVDDLQWSDVSSLDTLAYLVAGFREQRLAVLATCREEHRPEGHPLHGWLADLRRMPGFAEVTLDRLGLEETAALLAEVRDEPRDLELAALVMARSDGNPYLTELLGGEIAPGAHDVPEEAPRRLRDALTAAWHRLDPEARDVTRFLAASGRPAQLDVLSAVAELHGTAAGDVEPALARAGVGGVVRRDPGGWFWFRHPVLADVLAGATTAHDARLLHASFAKVLSARPATAPADLAVHHEQAGDHEQAYRCSLEAADAAVNVRAWAEAAEHLVRACDLWGRVGEQHRGSTADHVALLERAAHACRRAIRYDEAQSLLAQARGLVDPGADPLLSSWLLSEWSQVPWDASGPGTALMRERYEALRLTDDFPDSVERARALGDLASAAYWDGDREAAHRYGDAALDVARRTGSDLALARALDAWIFSRDNSTQPQYPAIGEALRLARDCGDVDEMMIATIWLMNALDAEFRTAGSGRIGRDAFTEALEQGAPHYGYLVAAFAAGDLLEVGRLEEAAALLREALAVRCVGIPGASTRFVATKHALRTGDLEAARKHLDRALELVDPDFGGLRHELVCTVAEVMVAEGDPLGALAWMTERLEADLMHRWDERMLGWLARVLGDLVREARDRHDEDAEKRLLADLDVWVDRFTAEIPEIAAPEDRPEHIALLVTRAEIARCRQEPDERHRWERVVVHYRARELGWHEAYALQRLGEAMVAEGLPRSATAVVVRRLHALATAMGTPPLREEAEALARAARISLVEPVTVAEQVSARRADSAPWEVLTAREREVIGHLVAGRTNAEIARSLVVSEKTVSVHVSNILRKTSTSNRGEAAAWARRRT